MLNSIFANAVEINILERTLDHKKIIIISIAFILFLLYALVKILYKGYYYRLFYLLFRQDYSTSSFAESNTSFINAGKLVFIASVLSYAGATFSIFAYNQDFNKYFDENQVVVASLSIIAIVIGLFFIKWLIYSLFGWVFDAIKPIKEYLNLFYNNIRALGIIIFPFFLFVPFLNETASNILTYSVLGLITLTLLYNYYTFWQYSIKIKFFNHYTFLYFCVFEILPILIVLKLLYG